MCGHGGKDPSSYLILPAQESEIPAAKPSPTYHRARHTRGSRWPHVTLRRKDGPSPAARIATVPTAPRSAEALRILAGPQTTPVSAPHRAGPPRTAPLLSVTHSKVLLEEAGSPFVTSAPVPGAGWCRATTSCREQPLRTMWQRRREPGTVSDAPMVVTVSRARPFCQVPGSGPGRHPVTIHQINN